jgi:NAD(P)-dependent dehydrogenase (short-subunit alcohol dehydrogenase family)
MGRKRSMQLDLLSEIPLGRMGKPEEIASLAVYLVSDASAYVSGSTLFIVRAHDPARREPVKSPAVHTATDSPP